MAVHRKAKGRCPGQLSPSKAVACSWSKAGDPEAGLAWLSRAVESGFRAPRLIEGEDDLAAVRALPGYADLIRTLHDG